MGIVTRTPQASLDLIDAWLYISADNMSAADRFIDHIEEVLLLLASNPYAGTATPTLDATARGFPVGAYLVLYEPLAEGILFLRLWHCAQSMEDLQLGR